MAKQAQARTMPETLAFKADKHGVHSIVDGAQVPAQRRIPSADANTVALVLNKMLASKVQVSPYAFFAPKYDAEGKMVYAKDAKGAVVLKSNGRAAVETVELSKALKEVEEGKRTVELKHGKWGTFRVNILATQEETKAKAKAEPEYFDVAALFATTKK